MNILNTIELYIFKWLRWTILILSFMTIFKNTNIGEEVGKLEPSHVAGWNVKRRVTLGKG